MTEALKRVFLLKNQELQDPNPSLSTKEVKEFYANQYPEITNADIVEKINDDRIVYEFKTNAGTKG